MSASEQIEQSSTLRERAIAAVVKTHDDEIRAYLAGEVEANAWRPERYVDAVLDAVRVHEARVEVDDRPWPYPFTEERGL